MPGRQRVTRAGFIAQVRRALGKPYVYGAAGPDSFDCSGLVYYSCRKIGIMDCPRTSEAQFAWTERVTVPLPGDLVFFEGAELDPPPGHVGIVIAPGLMIDAPHTGTVVQQASYGTNGSGVNRFMGYGRIPGLGPGRTANQAIITDKHDKQERTSAVLGTVSGMAVIAFILLLVVGFAMMALLLIAARYS